MLSLGNLQNYLASIQKNRSDKSHRVSLTHGFYKQTTTSLGIDLGVLKVCRQDNEHQNHRPSHAIKHISNAASSTGAKHLEYFLAQQQQQQNQTIKNNSSTSRLPEIYQKDAQFFNFHKVTHPSVSLSSCTGRMSLKMIKT